MLLLLSIAACCFPLGEESPGLDPIPTEAPAPPLPPPIPEPDPVDLTIPDSVEGMAARLEELETAIRDPEVPVAELADLGHAQQRILRHLAGDRVASAAVIEALSGKIQSSVARLVLATSSMAHTVAKPRTDLPNWKIVDPLPAEELLLYYYEAEAAHGVPWSVLASINLNETRMGQLRGLSHVGAKGPMQFMPATWAAYGKGDPNNDRDAILAAGNYLKEMGWANNPAKAIWHYNHHDDYVRGIQLCAEAMDEEPRMFHAFRGWKVYYRTIAGSIWLRTGYSEPERISIEAYCDRVGGEPYCPDVH